MEDIRVEYTPEPVKVYNFQVEDYHTYYVGELAVWVHNADKYNTIITPDMEQKILEGQRVSNTNRIRGGHSPNINNNNQKYVVDVLAEMPDGTKKIKFITEFSDGSISKIKTSTVFPDSWSDTQIIDSIKKLAI